jgi:hypothetical protein
VHINLNVSADNNCIGSGSGSGGVLDASMRQRFSLTGLHERGEEAGVALPKAESLNLYGEARR